MNSRKPLKNHKKARFDSLFDLWYRFNMNKGRKMIKDAGPNYNVESSKLKKFRSMAKDGLKELSYAERQAYGEAVEKAILAKQKIEMRAGLDLTERRINCASGTNYTTGAEIEKAIRLRQYNSLMNCPSAERKARTDIQWKSMYERAMKEKNETKI